MNKLNMKKLLCIILYLLSINFAFATDYTVGGGKDYSDIDDCVNAISAPDRCVVDAGSYGLQTFTNSGASNTSRITVIAATADDQQSHTITGRVNFTNESYITLDGFELASGIRCNGCSYITLKNNYVSNSDIGFGGSGGSGTKANRCSSQSDYLCGDDLLFEGNTFTDRGDDVFKQNGNRWVARNNIANNIDDSADEHIDFFQLNCGIFSVEDQFLVEDNDYHNITGSNTHFTLINCSGGTHHGFIIRYNRAGSTGGNAVTFQESGSTLIGVVVYNNTFFEIAGGSDRFDYAININAVSQGEAPNNIFYDSFDRTSASYKGVYGTNDYCAGAFAYDPDGSISNAGCLQNYQSTITLNTDPNFVSTAITDGFELTEGSQAIDHGVNLTTTTNTGSGSTSLDVSNPYYFQDGWAGVDPDCIAVNTVSNISCIERNGINYSTGEITLVTPISWLSSNDVWLYKKSDGQIVLIGDAPDAGAEEYGEEDTSTTIGTPSGSFSLQ